MKRIITLFLTFIMIASLVSCGGNGDAQTEVSATTPADSTAAEDTETDVETTAFVTTDDIMTVAVTTEEITTETEQTKTTYKIISLYRENEELDFADIGYEYPTISFVEKQGTTKVGYFLSEGEENLIYFSTEIYLGGKMINDYYYEKPYVWYCDADSDEDDINECKMFNERIVKMIADLFETYLKNHGIPEPINKYYFKSGNKGDFDYHGYVYGVYDFGDGLYCMFSADAQGYGEYGVRDVEYIENVSFAPAHVDAFYQIVESNVNDFTSEAKELIEKMRSVKAF